VVVTTERNLWTINAARSFWYYVMIVSGNDAWRVRIDEAALAYPTVRQID
jgi:hypothetical protein